MKKIRKFAKAASSWWSSFWGFKVQNVNDKFQLSVRNHSNILRHIRTHTHALTPVSCWQLKRFHLPQLPMHSPSLSLSLSLIFLSFVLILFLSSLWLCCYCCCWLQAVGHQFANFSPACQHVCEWYVCVCYKPYLRLQYFCFCFICINRKRFCGSALVPCSSNSRSWNEFGGQKNTTQNKQQPQQVTNTKTATTASTKPKKKTKHKQNINNNK